MGHVRDCVLIFLIHIQVQIVTMVYVAKVVKVPLQGVAVPGTFIIQQVIIMAQHVAEARSVAQMVGI